MFQLVRWSFFPSPPLDQRKSLYNFSIFKPTDVGILKRDTRDVWQTWVYLGYSPPHQKTKRLIPTYPISSKFYQPLDPKIPLTLDSLLKEDPNRIRGHSKTLQSNIKAYLDIISWLMLIPERVLFSKLILSPNNWPRTKRINVEIRYYLNSDL